MESLIEFKKRVKRVIAPKKHKIRNSLGVYDAYKWIRKNKWLNIGRVLTEHEFYSIIRTVNNYIANAVIKGEDINLPHKMGSIQLRKYNRVISTDKDGKVTSNLPIDWDKTLQLWHSDKSEYRCKTLIRMDVPEVFKIVYLKSIATYNNKAFYDISFNKDLKIELKNNIKRGSVDALYIGRKVNYVE